MIETGPSGEPKMLGTSGHDHTPPLMVFLALGMLAVGVAVISATRTRTSPVLPAVHTINPNTAPWHELATLPRIGEGLGRAIVRYRQSDTAADRPAGNVRFSSASDLTKVRGIGPVTVQRIAPYLSFDRQ
ncbi:MAG: helix-hairpin-helix domain-containing protein [Phycisphaerae bacterium]|jgi:DNA uptake protein ComE-like DNA-binding protein